MKPLTPWHDENGISHFPYQATHDKVFIYRTEPPVKFLDDESSVIEIPGDFQKYHRDGTGILMSIGPGWYGPCKGKYHFHPTSDQLKVGMRVSYDKNVPWGWYDDTALDGKQHFIVVCGYKDLFGEFK